MTTSALKRKVNVVPRTPEFIKDKMNNELAVIALNPQNGEWVGFCYIEVWQHGKYVANSGLIVSPKYRGLGVSRDIKIKIFEQSRWKFPEAKLFSLTTSPAVIHVNNSLGYKVTPFAELLSDVLFSNGGNSWVNYIELMQNESSGHSYVAMTFTPEPVNAKPVFFALGRYFVNMMKMARKGRIAGNPVGMIDSGVVNAF